MKLEIPGKPRPYIMGHRGNLDECPENTLASFRRALEQGADIIETDVHLSADGVFMLIHDATLDRTTNGTGPVATRTLAELRTFSASYGRPEFEAERIPTLQELFEIIHPDTIVALELKTDRFLEPEVCRRFVDQIRAAGMLQRVVMLSFSLARVQAVQAAAPDVPVGFITMSRLLPKAGADLLGPFFPLLFLNPFYVWLAHRSGQPVAPLDPTPDSRLWYYRLLGCDAILTNNPGMTRRALGR
ncbi:MAG: hypothetical protein IT326_04675 [Anaerolineae bacterium]|nr:hypothetical protein [Anaerolineae bacterium]